MAIVPVLPGTRRAGPKTEVAPPLVERFEEVPKDDRIERRLLHWFGGGFGEGGVVFADRGEEIKHYAPFLEGATAVR